MMEWLLPFQLPFMQDAFLIAVIVAVPCALLSCFLVLKGWSLMGDAVTHAVLPGVVGAFVLGVPLAIGAFVTGFLCAVLTGYFQGSGRIKEDTAIGIVFSGFFAAGLVMIAKVGNDLHLDHILFGDMLGVLPGDIWFSAGVALVIVAGIGLVWRNLLLHAFDPAQAQALGLPVGAMHYGLLAALALTCVGALKAVGIILTIALLIAPGAIAYLVTRRFAVMLPVAVGVAVLSSVAGVWASFFLGSAPGATIVVALTVVFLGVFGWRQAQQVAKA